MIGFGRALALVSALAAAGLCGHVLLSPLPPAPLRAAAGLFLLVFLGLALQALLLRAPAPGDD